MTKSYAVINPQALLHPDTRVVVSIYQGPTLGFSFVNVTLGDSKVTEIVPAGVVKDVQ